MSFSNLLAFLIREIYFFFSLLLLQRKNLSERTIQTTVVSFTNNSQNNRNKIFNISAKKFSFTWQTNNDYSCLLDKVHHCNDKTFFKLFYCLLIFYLAIDKFCTKNGHFTIWKLLPCENQSNQFHKIKMRNRSSDESPKDTN